MVKRVLTVMLCCWSVVAAAQAEAQELRFYYCYAPHPASGTVFVSSTAALGPVEERRHYGARFAANLARRDLAPADTAAYCVMRPSVAEIDKGKTDLRRECGECGSASQFKEVQFAGESGAGGTAAAAAGLVGKGHAGDPPAASVAPAPHLLTAKPSASARGQAGTAPVPYQVAAGLSHIVNIKLIPQYEQAFVQVHYQFFLCGQDIYVSYSLKPVPTRGVNEVRLNAVVTGNFMKPVHVLQTARPVPGHQLGCHAQKYKVAPLSNFASQLNQGAFSDGTVMWSRTSTIEHLLGRFSMFASGAPWPPGSPYASNGKGTPPPPLPPPPSTNAD